MTITLQKAGDNQYRKQIKMLLAGPANSGKTLAGASFPNPLIANLRGNMMSLADKGTVFVDVSSEDELGDLHTLLSQEPDKIKSDLGFLPESLIIDTVDELQRILVNERLRAQKRAEMEPGDWMWLGRKMQTILEALADLPIHVVFVCHLKDVSDGDTAKLFIQPSLQGATTTQIHQYVDYSLYLHTKTIADYEEQTCPACGGTKYELEGTGDTNDMLGIECYTCSFTGTIKGAKTERNITWLRTRPDQFSDWIGDKSGLLPTEVEIDDINKFYDIFSNLVYTDLNLPASQRKVIGMPSEAPVEPPKATVRKRVAPPTSKPQTPATGNSGSGYFCDECGAEVESEEKAELAKVKFRKVLCSTHYDELNATYFHKS